MMETNTPLSKIVAVLLAPLTLVTAYELFDGFYVQRYLQNESEISRLENLTAQYQKRYINPEQLDKHLIRVKQKLATSLFFISDPKKSVATAKLQTKLKNLIRSKKGVLLSSQIIPVQQKNESFKSLTIRLQIRLSPQNLRSLLHQLERQKPYLFVGNLAIQPVKHARGADQPDRQDLTVELDVSGYLRAEATKNDT